MIEISVRGQWIKVHGFEFADSTIITTGNWLRTAKVHDEAWSENEIQDPASCIYRLRSQRPRADIFTFTQKPSGTEPKYSYYREDDSIAVVRLSTFDEWWMSVPQETRKNARRSAKYGVRIEIRELDDALVNDLVQLNNSQEIRQGRRYTHHGKSFEQVKKDHSSFVDRSDFICAYFENELVGFVKLVYRGEVASILNLLTNESHNDKRPSNALLKAVVERCVSEGMTHLTYGNFNYGNKRNIPITTFKIRHGFQEVLVPRYFVPLTRRGSLALALGLHRGLLGILPNRLLLLGVAARAKVYSFNQWFISRCSSIAERPNRNRQTGRSNPPAGSNT